MTYLNWPFTRAGQINREIKGSNVRVRLRTLNLPAPGVSLYSGPEQYVVGLNLSSTRMNLSGLHDGAKATDTTLGSVAVVPGKRPLRIQYDAGHYRYISCLFEPTYFEEVTGIGKIDTDTYIKFYFNMRRGLLRTLLKRIHEELEQPGFASSILVDSATNLCLVELAGYTSTIRREKSKSDPKIRGLTAWQLRRIDERIAAIDEMGSPTLSELGDLCGLSQFYMLRNFKASTGTTVHRYIEDIRLKRAKELLCRSSLSAKEIAQMLGFSSPAHFSATFRRLTSMSPMEYRVRTEAR